MTVATGQTTSAGRAPRSFRLAMFVPTLLVDVIAPIAIFKTLGWLGATPVWALAGGCVPPLLNNLRTWTRSRRLDPVGILIMASMATGVMGSIISGNLGSRIVTDCVIGSAWGAAFLGSLIVGRPVLFFLIRAVVAGEDAERTDIWNSLWHYAAFRSAMRSMTAACSLIYFARVLITLVLAQALTTDAMATIAPLMSTGGTLGLFVLIRFGMQAMRRRLEARENLKWPL